jgi:copper transport protein
LVRSSPQDYSILRAQPSSVVFAFDQPVESPFDVVRVYGVHGRVDDGRLVRAAKGTQLGVGLRAGLAPGSYLASYRVASEDGHIGSGSIVFSVRRRGDVLSLARIRQSVGTRRHE